MLLLYRDYDIYIKPNVRAGYGEYEIVTVFTAEIYKHDEHELLDTSGLFETQMSARSWAEKVIDKLILKDIYKLKSKSSLECTDVVINWLESADDK